MSSSSNNNITANSNVTNIVTTLSNETCPAWNATIETGAATPFENTWFIQQAHTHAIRFGYPSNLTQIIQESSSSSSSSTTSSSLKQYAYGATMSSLVLCVFFVLWMLLLLVLRCLGYRRVGFCAGTSMRRPPRPMVEEEEEEEGAIVESKEMKDDQLEDEEEIVAVSPDITVLSLNDAWKNPQQETSAAAAITTTNATRQNEGVTEESNQRNTLTDQKEQDQEEPNQRSTKTDINEQEQEQEHEDLMTPTIILFEDPAKNHQNNLHLSPSSPLRSAEEKKMDSEEWVQWHRKVKIREIRLRRTRITVLVCIAVIVAFSIVLLVKGLFQLQAAAESTLTGIEIAMNLSTSAVNLIDEYTTVQSTVLSQVVSVANEIGVATCPRIIQGICSNLQLTDCSSVASASAQVDDYFQRVGKELYDGQLAQMRSDIVRLGESLAALYNKLEGLHWVFAVATAMTILLVVVTLFIAWGVISAWRGQKHWVTVFVQSWIAVPLFTVLVLVSWAFSLAFIVGAVVTADACYDSPNSLVLVRDDLPPT